MANPYQDALLQRLNPNPRNTGFAGGNAGADVAQARGLNAPVLQAPPSFVETPPTGPPPIAVDTKQHSPLSAASMEATNPSSMRGRLLGFDFGKLDAGKNDPKYVFAKHAQNFDDRDASSRDALIQALRGDASGFFKDARLEGDILKGSYDPDTGGYGDVDIIKGLKAGGEGWQWGAMPGSVQGGGGDPTGPMGPSVPAPQPFMPQLAPLPDQGGENALPTRDDQSPYLAALLAQLGL